MNRHYECKKGNHHGQRRSRPKSGDSQCGRRTVWNARLLRHFPAENRRSRKEGLLTAALDEVYDSETEDILTDIVREPRPLIADMWRRIVAVNARRPIQVHMFSTLSAEAIDPNHPAHEYFANRELHNADTALNIRWRVPEGVDTRRLLNAGFAMMDGVQLRWLRTPGQDLNAMWAECEDALFPLPMWEGYR